MPPSYLDFRLTLAGTPGSYTVAAQGPGGISIDPVPTQLGPSALRPAVEQLRDGLDLEPAALQQLGAALFDALFPRKVARAFERAYEDLPAQTDLRLKLAILPPELADLPWELLYDPDVGAFLAGRATLPIVRMIESGAPSASLLASQPLRVLQVQASPKDVAELNLAGSEAAIRAGLGSAGDVTTLHHATPADLRAALRQGSFHVLHVDSHGYYDAQTNAGYLVLEGADGRAQSIRADQLANALDGSTVRLVVLAACETAAQSQARRFSGLAQHLMRIVPRLPAVMAMQFDIPDRAAIAFFAELYRALAGKWPVDAAVVEGRRALLERAGERPDWATPVLFLRLEDGYILREEETSVSDQEPTTRIETGGGDYVGGSKVVHGDVVHGDKVGGDKITVGNVTGSVVAVGRGAQASVQQGVSATELDRLLQPLMAAIQGAPAAQQVQAAEQAEALKQELAKGNQADDGRLAKLIDGLVGLVPGAVGAVVSIFASPILTGVAGPVTRFMLDKIQGK